MYMYIYPSYVPKQATAPYPTMLLDAQLQNDRSDVKVQLTRARNESTKCATREENPLSNSAKTVANNQDI